MRFLPACARRPAAPRARRLAQAALAPQVLSAEREQARRQLGPAGSEAGARGSPSAGPSAPSPPEIRAVVVRTRPGLSTARLRLLALVGVVLLAAGAALRILSASF